MTVADKLCERAHMRFAAFNLTAEERAAVVKKTARDGGPWFYRFSDGSAARIDGTGEGRLSVTRIKDWKRAMRSNFTPLDANLGSALEGEAVRRNVHDVFLKIDPEPDKWFAGFCASLSGDANTKEGLAWPLFFAARFGRIAFAGLNVAPEHRKLSNEQALADLVEYMAGLIIRAKKTGRI